MWINRALCDDDINVLINSFMPVRGFECVCVYWACVLTKVTVFSLHIFTRNNIVLTLKTDVHNTLPHTCLYFISER